MKKSYIKPHVRVTFLSPSTIAAASIDTQYMNITDDKVITDPKDLG